MADEAPHIFVEPPLPTTSEFSTVEHVRSVICQLDAGSFRLPALLLERMMWNPRLRGVVDTRMAGLISTEIKFEPAINNRDGRRAVKELSEDWPLIAPPPMRKQLLTAAIFLGFALGQRPLDESPSSGRKIFKLRPYWPGFASWQSTRKRYQIQTGTAGEIEVPTPADRVLAAHESPWLISEPYGVNSYRHALIHAAWRPWLGHDWAIRDQARASEKHGVGMLKAKYPVGSGAEHKAAVTRFTRGLRTAGSEGVLPLEQRADGAPSFDVETLEFNGAGFQAISDTMNSNAVALAILLLGHNLTTEIKGGGSYAAAGVADYIRDDKKYEDCATEADYARSQLIVPWAVANYGDPGLAPIMRGITDSPAVNKSRAEMINQLASATAQLRSSVPRVDLEALAEEFRLPMLAEGVRVQVPGAPEQENDNGAQPDAAPNSETQPMPGAE